MQISAALPSMTATPSNGKNREIHKGGYKDGLQSNISQLQKLVEAQMKNLTDLLEAEIQTTTSWWVKIWNRLYITLIQQAVKAIVADVKQKIA